LISESSFSEVRDERLQHSQRRFGHVLPSLLALGGIGLAATAFVFLFISEGTPLFGFMEPGYGGCTDTDDEATEPTTAPQLSRRILRAVDVTKAPNLHRAPRREKDDSLPIGRELTRTDPRCAVPEFGGLSTEVERG
jgi:hypothetical protein